MKATIIYSSHHGTTKAFAENINSYLKENKVETTVASIEDINEDNVKNADVVFLGSWTMGLFLFAQHPDSNWLKKAVTFPEMNGKKVALFTTYKVATGKMFKKMEKNLGNKIDAPVVWLKAKSSNLTDDHKKMLNDLVAG